MLQRRIAAAMTATILPLRPRPEPGPSLTPMLDLCGHDLGAVNRVILDRMQSPVALIPELAGHLSKLSLRMKCLKETDP